MRLGGCDMPVPMRAVAAQVAPGRYEIDIPIRRSPVIAQVRDPHGGIVRRFALAGRYPPEFDAIGNDRRNLQALADHVFFVILAADEFRAVGVADAGLLRRL